MTLPSHRDPKVLQPQLSDWISERIGAPVTVTRVAPPAASGFGNDTVLITARWDDGDGVSDHDLTVRVQLTAQALFPQVSFATQHRVMTALATRPALRVPRVRWYEESAEPLGAPFLVMDRVEGRSPSDDPPYTEEGWLKDSPLVIQRAVWERGLDAMAAIHQVDHHRLGLGDLDPCPDGRSRFGHRLARWADLLHQASPDERQAVPEAALAWLRENQPLDVDEPTLCWGDSRIANQLFVGLDEADTVRVSALLDWAMVHVGDPVLDLGWFTWADEAASAGLDLPRLSGLPLYRWTTDRWEEATGRSTRNLRWAEILAGVGLTVTMLHLADVLRRAEVLAPGAELRRLTAASSALERALSHLDVHPADVA